MYSLYKNPSGEVNLDFSNIASNLSGMSTRGNDAAKKVKPKCVMCSNVMQFQFSQCSVLQCMQDRNKMNKDAASALRGVP